MFCGAAAAAEKSTATSTPAKLLPVIPLASRLLALSRRCVTAKPYSGASCSMRRPILPCPTMARFMGVGASASARVRELRDHFFVNFDGFEEFFFGDAFFERVGYVNAAGSDQVRLAPGVGECGNVGGVGDDG